MSDILQSTGMSELAVQFIEAAADGWFELSYVQGKHNAESIVLDRAELQALYARIQNIMADELRAAGWVEAPSSHGDRWFYLPTVSRCMTPNPIDVAWQEMMEAKNDSRN